MNQKSADGKQMIYKDQVKGHWIKLNGSTLVMLSKRRRLIAGKIEENHHSTIDEDVKQFKRIDERNISNRPKQTHLPAANKDSYHE